MDYYEALGKYFLPPSKQLEGPVVLGVDINVPLNEATGTISGVRAEEKPNLRLVKFGQVADELSTRCSHGIVMLAHQGSPGEKDFARLKDHAEVLNRRILKHSKVVYKPMDDERAYCSALADEIAGLGPGEIFLHENVRMFTGEQKDMAKCEYRRALKKAGVKTCVFDALPKAHRDNSSNMLTEIAPTFVGRITQNELHILSRMMYDGGRKAALIGGKKPKFESIPGMAERMKIYTAGVTAIQVCELYGYNTGPENRNLIVKYSPEEVEILREVVHKYEDTPNKVEHPVDFIVLQNGERLERKLGELEGKPYRIMDIGPETVEKFAEELGSYDMVMRGGPNGVFEKGYDNGIKLLRKLLVEYGCEVNVMGGDTVEEMQTYGLCEQIESRGGHVWLSGGSLQEIIAGKRAPPLDAIMAQSWPLYVV